MQACMIRLSINKDLKLRKGKGKRKTNGSEAGLYKYLKRGAKALAVSEPIVTWQNIVEFGRWRTLILLQAAPLKVLYNHLVT